MVVVTDGNGPAGFLHSKADRAAFLVVSCDYSGNSTGHVNNGNPRETGWEDYDYLAEVIRRVKASENANDAFTVGFSAGGHTSLAYACERPSTLKAAASVDEFMQVSNVPSAPLPVILFEGTADANVSYTMVKDTVDRWRAVDGLLEARPVTTYEASPRMPGQVSQATWRGEEGGTQVAFVTIIGGTHTYLVGVFQPIPDPVAILSEDRGAAGGQHTGERTAGEFPGVRNRRALEDPMAEERRGHPGSLFELVYHRTGRTLG
jgi:poly(3-hydroxybutyrate) depolymerase